MGHLLTCVHEEGVTMIKQKQRCREKRQMYICIPTVLSLFRLP